MTQPSQMPFSEAKTSIDSLIELLSSKGKLDLNTVSITLGVSPTIVEEWAKVLESGKLIKVSYEVGKMYLELLGTGTDAEVEQGISTATIKVEAQKSALLNEMEVEKITLDKYSKTLDDLSITVAGMENLYRQKLPNIQKLFSELDNLAAPMARKTKELQETTKAAEAYFGQLDKKVDQLYVKVDALQGADVNRALKQKEEMLKTALSRSDEAKAALVDLEDTRQALYSKISSDVDRQVKEFKTGLKAALNQIYAELKADSAEAVNIDKEIKTELVETSKVTTEAEKLRKESETIRIALMSSRDLFKDRYQKTVDEMSKASIGVNQKYALAQQQLDLLKLSMGGVSNMHDSIVSARADLDAIQKSIEASKANVNTIIDALRALNSSKLSEKEEAKAVADISKQSLAARVKGERIKRSLEDAAESVVQKQTGKAPAGEPKKG